VIRLETLLAARAAQARANDGSKPPEPEVNEAAKTAECGPNDGAAQEARAPFERAASAKGEEISS